MWHFTQCDLLQLSLVGYKLFYLSRVCFDNGASLNDVPQAIKQFIVSAISTELFESEKSRYLMFFPKRLCCKLRMPKMGPAFRFLFLVHDAIWGRHGNGNVMTGVLVWLHQFTRKPFESCPCWTGTVVSIMLLKFHFHDCSRSFY